MSTKKITLKEWQAIATNIRTRAENLAKSRVDQAFALAATVGIHRCACSLHNASIDDDMKGWCKDNPHRLKVARKANWMATEWCWQPTRTADRIINRLWKQVQ